MLLNTSVFRKFAQSFAILLSMVSVSEMAGPISAFAEDNCPGILSCRAKIQSLLVEMTIAERTEATAAQVEEIGVKAARVFTKLAVLERSSRSLDDCGDLISVDTGANEYYSCKTSQGAIIEHDPANKSFPYTVINGGSRLSLSAAITGRFKNGSAATDYSSIGASKDAIGLRTVGEDSPAVQACKGLDSTAKLPTMAQYIDLLTAFDNEVDFFYTGRLTFSVPRLTTSGLNEMHKAIPDMDGHWSWSSSVRPDDSYGAYGAYYLYGHGGYIGFVPRVYAYGGVRCVAGR